MKKIASLCMALIILPSFGMALNFGIKKDHVGKVSKLAIISVYSNAEIRKQDARAGGMVNTIGFLKKMKDKKQNPEAGKFGGTELVDYAAQTYAAELGKIKGWAVSDIKTITASPAYQSFIADYKKEVGPKGLEQLEQNRTAASNMVSYLFLNHKDKKKLSDLSSLCDKLGVDSVAIVELDLTQRSPTVTTGVAGKAWPSVGPTLTIVTKDGNIAIGAQGKEAESKEPVEMKMDIIGDTPFARTAFKEAILTSAQDFREEINRHLPSK